MQGKDDVSKAREAVEKLAQNRLLLLECSPNSSILRSSQETCKPSRGLFNSLVWFRRTDKPKIRAIRIKELRLLVICRFSAGHDDFRAARSKRSSAVREPLQSKRVMSEEYDRASPRCTTPHD